MSYPIVRTVLPFGLTILFLGAIAWAQERHAGNTADAVAVDVFVSVDGRSIVMTSLHEGAQVAKGDVICQLDASDLRDRLAAQEIALLGAEADVHAARIAREVAVMALNEYKEGTFRQELAAIEGEIKMAEATLSSAEDRLDWTRRNFEKGYTSMSEMVSDELILKGARFALERAQSKKKVLLDYSRDKTEKALKGAVEAARGRELAQQATRERSIQKRLVDQIGRCKVTAPIAGRIGYALAIGAGAVVHDGQLICRVVAEGTRATQAK